MDFVPVPTRASKLLEKPKTSTFKAVIFEEPKAYTKEPKNITENPDKQLKNNTKAEDDGLEFDIKKARNEVLRFAMNNQRNIKNKKKMVVFQAIKLGAKPKKTYKNYRELKEERQRLKDIREKRKELHQLGKNQTGAASVKCRSKTKIEKQKKKRAPVSAIDQHYGKVKKP